MKKLLTFILLIAIVFPMTLVASAQQKPLGDVNLNGAVEKYDYILVKRAVLGTVTLDDEQSANADANENGKVEKYDYILIKRHVMGTYEIFRTDPTLKLTQQKTVKNENFTSVSTFAEFLRKSERFALVPGLSENIVPQGIGRNPETGYTYISSYFNESGKASVISVLDEKGRFVAEYHVYNKNGTPFTGHMGGICVTEDYIYFSGPSVGDYYSVAEFALKDLPLNGSHNITIDSTVTLPIHSSYLFYDDGILWVGTFYLAGSYDLGKYFNFKTSNSDGGTYGGYAAAFVLDGEEKRLTVKDGENYAVPSHVLATPDKVQGFAYKDGKVCLSKSYGRNNNSTLEYFKIDLGKADKSITVDGKSYPTVVLDSKNRTKTVTAMCMTEGITLDKNGKVMVLFESAAKKYYNSKNPTDYIWITEFFE